MFVLSNFFMNMHLGLVLKALPMSFVSIVLRAGFAAFRFSSIVCAISVRSALNKALFPWAVLYEFKLMCYVMFRPSNFSSASDVVKGNTVGMYKVCYVGLLGFRMGTIFGSFQLLGILFGENFEMSVRTLMGFSSRCFRHKFETLEDVSLSCR